jgi:hypothetical protein
VQKYVNVNQDGFIYEHFFKNLISVQGITILQNFVRKHSQNFGKFDEIVVVVSSKFPGKISYFSRYAIKIREIRNKLFREI